MLAAAGRPNALAPTLAAEIGLPPITWGTKHGGLRVPQTEVLVANLVVLIAVMFARLKPSKSSIVQTLLQSERPSLLTVLQFPKREAHCQKITMSCRQKAQSQMRLKST